MREKLLSLSKLRPRYDASTTPNAVPSGNVIEVIVYSQVTQLRQNGSPLLLRVRFAFLWWIFTQRGIKEDLIVSVQCPFGHLAVSVTG